MWPVLLTVHTSSGPVQVAGFGLCVSLAAVLAVGVAHLQTRELEQERMGVVVLVGALGLLVFGVPGAVAGALLAALVARLDPWRVGDGIGSALAVGEGLVGLGCLLAGCCRGAAPAEAGRALFPGWLPGGDLHLSVAFPWVTTVFHGGTDAGTPSYPTQLWTVAGGLALAAALSWTRSRRRFDGQALAIFLVVEPVMRLAIGAFRGEELPSLVTSAEAAVAATGASSGLALSIPHAADLLMIAAGCAVWAVRGRSVRAPTSPRPGPGH